MRKQKAKIVFTKFKDNDLPEIAQMIHGKMNGNPDFPSPPVSMVQLQTAITEYTAALVKAKDGSKQDTAIKNAKRKTMEEMLSKNGNYINFTAAGNLVKLEGSGYPLTKQPEPIGILAQPEFFKVSEGIDPGSVTIEIGIVEKSRGYIVLFHEIKAGEAPPANDMEWQKCFFTKTNGLITGLKSGGKYVFKCAATSALSNRMNMYNFSEPVERYVQ